MNIKLATFLVFLVSLLLLPIVSAKPIASAEYDFSATYEVITDSITREDFAEYVVTITNHKSYDDRFRFNFIFDPKWSYQTKPNYLGGINVGGESEREIILYVYPNKVTTGQSVVKVDIESESTGREVSLFPVVNLRVPFDVKEFEEDIRVTIQFPNDDKLDPREESTIRVELKNKNLLYVKNLSITLESSLINAEKSGINFKPLERKYLDFQINFDSKESPKTDTLVIKWKTPKNDFNPLEAEFEIIGYELPFSIETTKETPFPFNTENLILTNQGTLPKTEQIEIPASWLKRLLISSNADNLLVKDNGNLMFGITLDPGESKALYIRTNYWVILAIILVVLIGYLLYYNMRSPIELHKKAFVSATKEGGISEIKILVNIKNRGKTNVDDLKVTDFIPNIAEMEKEFEMGTLRPVKIFQHKTKGTVVKWDIGSLEKYEERILTYKIKSKLSILGGMTLPSSSVRFRYFGRDRKTSSKKAWMKL